MGISAIVGVAEWGGNQESSKLPEMARKFDEKVFEFYTSMEEDPTGKQPGRERTSQKKTL